MGNEGFEEGRHPVTTAEQFVTATTQIAVLHRELMRQQLGDEFLTAYADKVEAESRKMRSLSPEELLEVIARERHERERHIREQTFAFMEDGLESDPQNAERMARVQEFFIHLAGDEDDIKHDIAVTEIHKVIIDAFGKEGVHIPYSRLTWQLDMLSGIVPNCVFLICRDYEPGLSLALTTEDDECIVEPIRQFPSMREAVSGHPHADPHNSLAPEDLVTFPVLAEEVVRRLQEHVIPALEAELSS